MRSTHALPRFGFALGVSLLSMGVASAAHAQANAPIPITEDSDGEDRSEILVTGRLTASADLGGALGTRSILDTPLSVTTVTREDIADRGVTALGDVFARDASVVSQGSSNSIYSSNLSVRGIPLDATNGYKINGLPIYNFGVELPVAFFDRIDLLKGSSGFMYGFAAPGGIVNYVTAAPTAENRIAFDVGFRSNSIWSAHLDLGGPIAGEKLGYRLNVVGEDGRAPNGAEVNNKAAAVALRSELAPGLSWTFDGIYQKRKISDAIQGIATSSLVGTQLPEAPSGRLRLPVTDGSFLTTEYYLVSSGLRWEVGEDWTISADLSRSRNERRFSFDFAYLNNSAGDYTNFVNDSQSRNRFDQARLLAEGEFKTGGLSHSLVVGGSIQRYVLQGNVNQVFRATGTSNLFTGNPVPYTSTMVIDMYRSADITQRALFASDTVTILPGLSLLGGLRWTDYEQHGYGVSRLRTSTYRKKPVTPTLALLYKPSPTTTVYASYVESLEQGTIVSPIYANRDQILAPLRSTQYEAGFKIDEPLWSGSAAIFSVRRGSGYANAANEYVQDGYSLFRGLDLNGRIRPTQSLSVGGSLLWLDAKYKEASPAIEGNRVEGAPRFQAAGDVTYKVAVLPGLSLSADVRHNGNGTVNSAAVVKTGAYTLYGVGLKYDAVVGGNQATFRANLSNLTNKRYWYYIQPNFITPGDARTLSLSAQFAF